ncbi:MAG: HPF/RaiA family ribosome-associated protein [Polyangiaceae bacterium]
MQVQVSTDHNIEGREKLAAHVEGVVAETLHQLSSRITRVEVHLGDEVSHKTGHNDKRCMMEARVEGRQPIAVTDHAETIDQAVRGAADKLHKVLESTLARAAAKES